MIVSFLMQAISTINLNFINHANRNILTATANLIWLADQLIITLNHQLKFKS